MRKMDRKPIKLTSFVLAFSFWLLAFSKPVFAGWRCEPQYGGGEKCWGTGEIAVYKTVKKPNSNDFVENLYLNDPKYAPGDLVPFRLEVKNNGLGAFGTVYILDTLPAYLDFAWGPSGWNVSNKELRYYLYNLQVGETRTVEFTARVVSADKMPASENVICNSDLVLNRVRVEAEDKWGEDSSRICVEKKAAAEVKMPPTGASLWLVTLGFITTGLVGAKLALAKRIAR
jgi:uncharacterized repeat protein (TIGR01451 family)